MPSVSKAQHAFMAMSQSPKGRASLKASGKKPAPKAVGKEFIKADKGKVSAMPKAKASKPASYPKMSGMPKLKRVKGAPDGDNAE